MVWRKKKNNDTNSNTLDFVLIVMYLFYCFAAEFAHIIQKGVYTSTAPKLEQMIPSCIQSLKLFFFVPSNVAFLYFVWDFSTLHASTNCDQYLVCLPRTCFPITGEWNKTQWSLKSKGYIRQTPRSIWISPNLVEPAWLWYSGGKNWKRDWDRSSPIQTHRLGYNVLHTPLANVEPGASVHWKETLGHDQLLRPNTFLDPPQLVLGLVWSAFTGGVSVDISCMFEQDGKFQPEVPARHLHRESEVLPIL